ncbi:hypothetical protein C8J57DRAFT_1522127 [Mycena rebaudengoi]|nr:hypothetical protein C8J57DRAFT_1522127 [Mycena rebaudengoi]
MTLPKDTSPSHDDTGHDSDSTGSIPDLVAANDSDREADDEHMRPNTPVTPIRTRATGLNGITSAFQSMVIGNQPQLYQSRGRRGPVIGGQAYNSDGTLNTNWRNPANLAHRALRDTVADRFDKPVVVDGGGGSNFFHGGASYNIYARRRRMDGQMFYDLIQHVQHLERAVDGLREDVHWIIRHQF